jgi:hypothetical protein
MDKVRKKEQRFQHRQSEIRGRMVTRVDEGLPVYGAKKVRVRVKKRG